MSSITINLPDIRPSDIGLKIRATFHRALFSLGSIVEKITHKLRLLRREPVSDGFEMPRRFGKNKFKKLLPGLIVLGTAVFTVYLGAKVLGRLRTQVTPVAQSDSRITVAEAKSILELNKDFSFPLKSSAGKTLTEVKFMIESAELRDEIIVKGKRATAISGRTFLILTVKITSSYTKALEINAKDYFRLTVNDKTDELLAPDIHNDPVIVQPMSTKYTRLGFPINDTDTQMKLIVGEIEGEKTNIELLFQHNGE